MKAAFDIVILGLSITSSWGNGHATTWRGLTQGLAARGRRILFLERAMPWYVQNCDDPQPPGATTVVYNDLQELFFCFAQAVRDAELVIVGSYVPDGISVGEWVNSIANGKTAFYDIDTPVTLSMLDSGDCAYISPALVAAYDAYFSFAGGPLLHSLENRYGVRMARPLYCSVNVELYKPAAVPLQWDLGYLGTYSADRQPAVDALLVAPARSVPDARFVIAGPQYPEPALWPPNVHYISHLAPPDHPPFYTAQRFTLNVTRDAMKLAGYSPSVRLFEAAACGVPIISDWWPGLDSLFRLGDELLIAQTTEDVLRHVRDLPESRRLEIAAAARERVLREHTSQARAQQLEDYLKEMNDHLSPHSSRRYRRNRPSTGGSESGMAIEQQGQGSGSALGK